MNRYKTFPQVRFLVYDMGTGVPVVYHGVVHHATEARAKVVSLILNDWDEAIAEDKERTKQKGDTNE